MRRSFSIFLIASLISPAFVIAQNKQFQQRRYPQNQNIKPEISVLNENQRKEWQKIRIDFQKQKNEKKAKLQNARLDLQQLMSEQRMPDEKALDKKLAEIAGYSEELRQLSHNRQIEFRKLITDEQWRQIQDVKKERSALKRRDRMNQKDFRRSPNLNL